MPSCAGQQRGGKAAILVDFEDTYGVTPGAVTAFQVPFLSESLSGSRAQNTSDVINGRRDPSRPFQGNQDVQGSIQVPVDKRSLGIWLSACFGFPVTSGAGPYVHTYTIDSTNCIPSMVIEKQMTDVPRYYTYNGVKISSMSISFGGDGELVADIELVGSAGADSAATIDASPTVLSYEQFRQFDAAIDEGGSANGEFTELSMDWNNGLDTEVFTIGNGGTRGALPEGKMELSGSGTLLYDNQTIYDKAKNGTESSIKVTMTRGSDSLVIDLPEVEYGLNDPQIEGNQGVSLNLDYQAFFDDDAGDSAIEIVLTNDVASYEL